MSALNKKDLRKEFRRIRREIPRDEFARMNAALARRIIEDPRVEDAEKIFSYISFGTEADTRAALRELLSGGKTIITPAADPAAEPLHWFHFLRPDDPLLRLQRPEWEVTPDVSRALELPDVDVFIVPGLVWDATGHRIGYGGGFFDRLLSEAAERSAKIGIAFECQMIDKVPQDGWDQPVDLILTEKRTIESTQKAI